MHPLTCDLTTSVSVDTRKTTYLVNMESIKSPSSSTKQVVSTTNNPTQIQSLSSSKSSENYVSTTTRTDGANKEARFQCGYCDKSFATPSKVKRHILTHTGEKPFVCQFCQRGFSQKVHMMEHISKHHADESLKAQQDAATSAAMQAAVTQAAAPAPLIRTLANNKTQQVYSSQGAGITAAVPVIQTGSGLRLPGSSEVTLTGLASPGTSGSGVMAADSTMASIQTIPENSYIVAEFSLKPEEGQEMHQSGMAPDTVSQSVTSDDMEPVQHEILATIPLSSSVTIGQGATCDALTTALNSVTGEVSQSNERPFVCPHCSADFIRQSNLSVHMMKVHGETVEVRTHQCSYCDKKFKYPNKRRLHEMTHTGEKPNVCQFCTMGFFKKSRLRVHLTKHHGIPEEEVNNPNSSYMTMSPTSGSPPDTPTTNIVVTGATGGSGAQTINIQKTIQSLQTPVNGVTTSSTTGGEMFSQYCQKPFSNKEEEEAMEFEQLDEMFDEAEFSGLAGVGNGSATDIIQNALLTAGIENGLGSPSVTSVTDSDSVVTISEADIDSFSIGFIPDGNWSTEVVGTSTSDPFYPSQPLDLKTVVSGEAGEAVSGSDSSLASSLQETFQNIKPEPLNSLPNLTSGDINGIWETTVALPTLPCPTSTLNTIIKTEPLLSNAQGEIFTTSSSTLNGILTETLSLAPSDSNGLSTSIISLPANIINGNDLDLSKLTNNGNNFTVTTGTNFLDAGDHHSFQGTIIQATSTSRGVGQPIVWQDDPTLPAGWKTRQHYREGGGNKVDIYFMAPDGSQFRSKWKIVEHMETSGHYSQADIDWVRSSITTPKPDTVSQPRERPDKLKREWKDDPKTVPDGWKVAWTTTSDNRSKIAFMSPDKKIFHSRKAALQHMMQAGIYTPEDILKMTKGLNVLLNVGDEWKEGDAFGDKSLPDGWKIRSHQWWCQKRNSHRIHYEFLSPDNEFFKSRKAVVEHMNASGVYTAEQIEMVKQQATIITDRSIKKKVTTSNGPTRQDLSPCNPLIGWKTGNTTLPIGWKIKRHEYANQTVYFYMSPKGDIIKSRRAVLEYMFDDETGGYTEKDFLTVISGAKQRKVALQELYDAKLLRKGIKRKRRIKSSAREDSELEDGDVEGEEQSYNSEEELDKADEETEEVLEERMDGDGMKRVAKKPKVEKEAKEAPLPTRRSGRIKEKKKEVSSDNEGGSDSEGEMNSGDHRSLKRRSSGGQEADIQVVPVVVPPATGGQPEVKRKRGRPPKISNQTSFEPLQQTGEVRPGGQEVAQERPRGEAFVKLELLNGNEIKDLSSTTVPDNLEANDEITKEHLKQEELEGVVSQMKQENFLKIEQDDEKNMNSIHTDQNAMGKVKVDEFFVTRDYNNVTLNLVKDEVCNGSNELDSVKNNYNSSMVTCPQSSYDVVVNVLHELVSSISE